jgi:hypothetical protein
MKLRHANNFADGDVVFEWIGVSVMVRQWNEKGKKTFDVYLMDERVGSSSNLPKAVGIGIMELHKRGVVS